jgi:hypothetical protein
MIQAQNDPNSKRPKLKLLKTQTTLTKTIQGTKQPKAQSYKNFAIFLNIFFGAFLVVGIFVLGRFELDVVLCFSGLSGYFERHTYVVLTE